MKFVTCENKTGIDDKQNKVNVKFQYQFEGHVLRVGLDIDHEIINID